MSERATEGDHPQQRASDCLPKPQVHRSRIARGLYGTLGVGCVGLGTIGAFLPVMPTTIFLIIAAWAFARSSPRLYLWLYTHPRFGPMLTNWYSHRVISSRAKRLAVVAMAASLAITAWTTRSLAVSLLVGAILAAVALYLLTRPSEPPRDARV